MLKLVIFFVPSELRETFWERFGLAGCGETDLVEFVFAHGGRRETFWERFLFAGGGGNSLMETLVACWVSKSKCGNVFRRLIIDSV